MSYLTDNFLFDVVVLVGTIRPQTTRKQSQLAGDNYHDRKFSPIRWELRREDENKTSKTLIEFNRTNRQNFLQKIPNTVNQSLMLSIKTYLIQVHISSDIETLFIF